MFLLRVVFGSSHPIDAVEERQAFALFRQDFAERVSHELVLGFIDQPAKSGIDVAHDMRRSLECGHRQRRVLEAGLDRSASIATDAGFAAN